MDNNNVALITKMVLEAVEKQKSSEKEPGYLVPVGVSARHIHLTQEHVEALFGPEYQLTKKKELMGGQFASNETVTIVGLKLRAIENVRILGPVRSRSQVEISATDAIKLGVKAPIRESGNVAGSAPIAVVGPKGAIYLDEGCIIAKRHIHMPPKDAMAAGVHDGDIYPYRWRMKEVLFSITYRSVWMTALHLRCISILTKRMQRKLRVDRL